jgi:beta-glucanase (GH16 family)
MHLVFNANFSGSSLNPSIWDTCYPWFPNQSAGCQNFANKEVEWYAPSQVQVSGGALNLVAQPVATAGFSAQGAPAEYGCRSGMVTTHPGFNFEYGYVQVVADIPNGAGLWPALWLAASNLKWPPEIDMLEHWGKPRSTSGMFFHPIGAKQALVHVPAADDVADGWHTFAVNWTPSSVTWYLDGNIMMTVMQNIPHQSMYFIANLAAWANEGPGSCTGALAIKSVKVWQP